MPSKEKLIIDLWKGDIPKHSGKTLNITSILNNFKSFIKQVYQKEWRQNINKKKEQNTYFLARRSQKVEKVLTLKEK